MKHLWLYVSVIIVVALLISVFVFVSLHNSENKQNIKLIDYKVVNDYTAVYGHHWNTTTLRLKFNMPPSAITNEYNVYVYDSQKKMVGKDIVYGEGGGYLDIYFHVPINFVGTYYVGLGGAFDPNLGYYPFSKLDTVFKINFTQPSLDITGWSVNYKKESNNAMLVSIKFSFRVKGETPFYYRYIFWEIGDKSNGAIVGEKPVKEVDPNKLVTTIIYIYQPFAYGSYKAKITLSGCDLDLSDTININLQRS